MPTADRSRRQETSRCSIDNRSMRITMAEAPHRAPLPFYYPENRMDTAKAPGAGAYVFMIRALPVAEPDDYSKGARCGRICLNDHSTACR